MGDTLKDLVTTVLEGEQTIFKVTRDVEGAPGSLTIERRKLQPEQPKEPQRALTPARRHVFYAIDGFVAYLRRYGSDQTVLYADGLTRTVHAVLNEKAERGVETVVLELMPHPLAQPWMDLMQKPPLPIKDFVDFLRAHRRAIISPPGREFVLLLSQIKMAQEVTVLEGSGRTTINGVLVKTMIQGQQQSDEIDLPDVVGLRLPLFVGGAPVTVELDLVISSPGLGQGVTAALVSADFEAACQEAFDNEVLALEMGFVDEMKMVLAHGRPDYVDWAIVK
jgi:hypothetical protein